MPRIVHSLSAAGKGLSLWLAKYILWLLLTSSVTVGGVTVLMLLKDWTVKSLVTSVMAWPALGLAMLVAIPIAVLPFGRIYFGTALGGGLLYNLILLIA